MIRINDNFKALKPAYLFADIAQRVNQYQTEHPEAEIIRLGIGDVTRSLPDACIKAFHKGVDEQGLAESFRGYGPEKGYDFLRDKIARHDFRDRGADILADEIFVSDGSKCDTGNFQELFAGDTVVAIPDPVYPVYLDTNIMAGREENIVFLEARADNGFIPRLPGQKADLIYLCFPNNPTGATVTRSQLEKWVEFATDQKALILFDAAYEAFIRDPKLPRSIYEIPGARKVAVEFRSFSKTAGFTGTRCAYTVVPKDCMAWDGTGQKTALHPLWTRRQSTKFNGVSYPVQRAAEAVYTDAGKIQVKDRIDQYLSNARMVCDTMDELGLSYVGGDNSPYIWINGNGRDSWGFFDLLLEQAGIVCTPGIGFGRCGEGYIRISAFNSPANVKTAMTRIKEVLA